MRYTEQTERHGILSRDYSKRLSEKHAEHAKIMDANPVPHPSSSIHTPKRKRIDVLIRRIIGGFTVFCAVTLAALYVFVGDQNPWGEFLTIWPPVLWLFGLIPLAILSSAPSVKRFTAVVWLAVLLFIIVTHEVRPMLRALIPSSQARGELRVVSWNVGGTLDMAAAIRDLRTLEPDICMLQEYQGQLSPKDRETFGTVWPHAVQTGELVILSRHPFRLLPAESVGPWSDPQLAMVDIEGRRLLIGNVRLMLPSLVLNPWEKKDRDVLTQCNAVRIGQFPKLAALIANTDGRERPDAILLGGDFNTAGHAWSLGPLRTMLKDVWPVAGRGWGGTCTTEYPVARIDALYTSSMLVPVRAEVGSFLRSDHRPLVADFSWEVPSPKFRN